MAGPTVAELTGVAGSRWKVGEDNETGKDLLGLTEYQVRTWDDRRRHLTTAVPAPAERCYRRTQTAAAPLTL